MHLINFAAQFAPAVESGTKPHTVRAKRADGRDPQPGDVLRLYTGLRTTKTRLLRQEVCEYVSEIQFLPPLGGKPQVFLAAELLSVEQLHALAQADGFDGWRPFVAFFEELYGLPFTGNLIGWSVTPAYVRLQ